MKTALRTTVAFAGSLVAGCLATVAIVSTAAGEAPILRPVQPTVAVDVVRLDPIVVTVSKSYFDAVQKQEAGTALARAAEPRKPTRG